MATLAEALHPDFDEAQMTVELAIKIIRRYRYFWGRSLAFAAEAPDCEIGLWQVAFATGADCCVGHTMSSKAQELGCSTACLSKGATKVCRMLDLPPSSWMLDAEARDSYRQLRNRQEEVRK